ncbi:MAG: OmpH family outer membrane protein [Gammaproteobacteria bacterium]
MAETKIGVVNAIRVLEASPQAQNAQKTLEKEINGRQQKLVGAQKEIKTLEDKLQKDGAVMAEAERGKLERDIVNRKRDLKRAQDEANEDIRFRRDEEFGKIQRDIAKAIQQVGIEQKFDLILGGDSVYFASKVVDITDAVIAAVKKQAGGAAPAPAAAPAK